MLCGNVLQVYISRLFSALSLLWLYSHSVLFSASWYQENCTHWCNAYHGYRISITMEYTSIGTPARMSRMQRMLWEKENVLYFFSQGIIFYFQDNWTEAEQKRTEEYNERTIQEYESDEWMCITIDVDYNSVSLQSSHHQRGKSQVRLSAGSGKQLHRITGNKKAHSYNISIYGLW